MALSLTVNETLTNMALIAANLDAGVLLVVCRQCIAYSVKYSLPLPPPPGISYLANTSSETLDVKRI